MIHPCKFFGLFFTMAAAFNVTAAAFNVTATISFRLRLKRLRLRYRLHLRYCLRLRYRLRLRWRQTENAKRLGLNAVRFSFFCPPFLFSRRQGEAKRVEKPRGRGEAKRIEKPRYRGASQGTKRNDTSLLTTEPRDALATYNQRIYLSPLP